MNRNPLTSEDVTAASEEERIALSEELAGYPLTERRARQPDDPVTSIWPPEPERRPQGSPRRRGKRRVFRGIALLLALAAVATVVSVWRSTRGSRVPTAALPVSSLRAVEAGPSLTDAAGERWTPDRYSQGGSLVSGRFPISDTSTPALYRNSRVGIRAVRVPVRTNGSYLVTLYFAETDASPGQRVFDVLAQGKRVATVDIARDVGLLAPYHLPFTVTVSNHRVRIEFVARHGTPILSAIDVEPVSPRIQLPARTPAWSDEFNGRHGAAPDPRHWTYDLGPGWRQAADYTARPQNVSLDGSGHLMVTARDDGYTDPNGGVQSITSARITTRGRREMLYGLAEARVEVADQPGFVSAFWALGADVGRVSWPRSGELDPLEVKGVSPQVLVEAVHMPCGRSDCPVVWERLTAASLAAGFHTFAVERAPGVIVYLLDGRETASLTRADVRGSSWVFDKPFYFVLNLLVGGWAGPPPATAHWPVRMLVDWVRVYR